MTMTPRKKIAMIAFDTAMTICAVAIWLAALESSGLCIIIRR